MSGHVPLQACRGREEVESLSASMSDKKNTDQLTPTTHQDVLISSATIADFVAFRSTVDGSFFIRHLCQVFQDHAHEDTVQDMLLRVNDKVREMRTPHLPHYQSFLSQVSNYRKFDYPSTPEYITTMKKKFKFRVTNENKERFQKHQIAFNQLTLTGTMTYSVLQIVL